MNKKHYIVQIVFTSLLAFVSITFLGIVPINIFVYNKDLVFNFELYGYGSIILSIIYLVSTALISLLAITNIFLTVIKSKIAKYVSIGIFVVDLMSYISMILYYLIVGNIVHKNQFHVWPVFALFFFIIFVLLMAIFINEFNSKKQSKIKIIVGLIVITIVSLILFACSYYFLQSYTLLIGLAIMFSYDEIGGVFIISIFVILGLAPSIFAVFFAPSFFRNRKAKIISVLISLIIVLPLAIFGLALIVASIFLIEWFEIILILSYVVLGIGWLLSTMYFLPFIKKAID